MEGEMMTAVMEFVAAPEDILGAWSQLVSMVPLGAIKSERDYKRAIASVNALLDTMGDDENHPLADLLDILSDRVEAYEKEHYPIEASPPHRMLAFLIDQHGLKQVDLTDCAPQNRISEFLSGKRAITKEAAKAFAKRFNVTADLFL
jgi:HTH-type transcriptional regulator/antitoxin HigA